MKKNLFTLFLFIVATTCFAQTVNVGVKGGLNLSKQASSPGGTFGQRLLAGFNLGGVVDVGFDDFSIQPGLLISTKGERFASGEGSTTYSLTYLEVPVNFLYRTTLTPDADLYFGGGPYYAYGVAASVSVGGTTYHGGFGNHAADPNYNGVYYKNPDYGINFQIGSILHKQYLFDVQYGLGLGNLSYGAGNTLRNRVISVSVGYMFR